MNRKTAGHPTDPSFGRKSRLRLARRHGRDPVLAAASRGMTR